MQKYRLKMVRIAYILFAVDERGVYLDSGSTGNTSRSTRDGYDVSMDGLRWCHTKSRGHLIGDRS